MQSQRHHRLIALSLGLLALSGGCISSVSAETQQMASDEAATTAKIDSQKNKVSKVPDRRRRRLGAKAMKLMGQQVTNEQQQHHQMQENDSNVIDEADEEFWARMLQQVGGSIPNQPPVANDVTATTRDDATVSGNVLANDSDPDGDDIAVVRADGKPVRRETTLTLGSGAILAINNKGDYTYDPNGQYDYLQNGETATDSFTYTIADTSGATDSAVVTITITASASTKPPTPAPTKAPTKAPTPVLVPPTPVPPTPGKSTIHSQQKIFIFFFFSFFSPHFLIGYLVLHFLASLLSQCPRRQFHPHRYRLRAHPHQIPHQYRPPVRRRGPLFAQPRRLLPLHLRSIPHCDVI